MHELIVSIKLALKNLRSNKGRTILTLAGVVIGITSVIVISSSGQGVKSYVLGQVQSFGTDIIQVEIKIPNTGKNSVANAHSQGEGVQITTLKLQDAKAIAKLPNVADYYAGTYTQEVVGYQENTKKSFILGASASEPLVDRNNKIAEGSFFSEADDEGLSQVAVIGTDIKKALFSESNPIGKSLKIKGRDFKVVGVAAARGTVGLMNYDEFIYLPIQTLQKKILGVDYIKFISVKVKDEKLLDVTVADINDLLQRRHNITDASKEDFAVTSIKEFQDTINKVFGAINILLLALTSISLVVGGVGIMNVMYVAVVERTFEIGLRKAVGAKSGDILKQFLLEAIFITFAGGVAGIILGVFFSELLSYIFSAFGFSLKFVITAQSLLLATGFSIIVGIIFGYYPAKKASGLSPMEALRKE